MVEEFLNAFQSKYGAVSKKWKHWVAQLDLNTCEECRKMHGMIYAVNEKIRKKPPRHLYCHCTIKRLRTIAAGYATQDGIAGGDFWIKTYGCLSDAYITMDHAKKLGWIPNSGNLSAVAPGKKIGGDVYQNRNNHLPALPGRQWYEADINYMGGFRSNSRLVYSNDGLIFATYDHYKTFVEIV